MQQDLSIERKARRICMLGKAGAGAACIFVFCCLAMHFVQTELSPVHDAISYYLNGRLGWVLGLGLVTLGIGSLSIAYGWHLLLAYTVTRTGLWMLALWGVGAIVGGLFPPDPHGHWDKPPSLTGIVHASAAMVAFLSFPAAALLVSIRIGRPLLSALAFLSAVALAAFFVCLAPVFSNRAPYLLGLAERLLLAVYISWLVLAGLALRRASVIGCPSNRSSRLG